MEQAAALTTVSPRAYLAFERASEERHEYVHGQVRAMGPATIEHSALAVSIGGELRDVLGRKGAHVLGCNMRLHVEATGGFVYADVTVLYDKPRFHDDQRDTLLNPRLLVEVLSDSTEAYDRGDKFAGYRTIASLQTYVLASQKEPRIEVFSRQADGSWVLREYGPGQQAVLPDLNVSLDVDRVYAGVLAMLAGGEAGAA